jgi:hypothetical protein
MTDLEIIFKIYEIFINNKGRKSLKTICLRNVCFLETLDNTKTIKKLKEEYWRFSAYYLGTRRKRHNHRPNYEDILELKGRIKNYLRRTNNIRQRNWFWIKPELE